MILYFSAHDSLQLMILYFFLFVSYVDIYAGLKMCNTRN